MQISQEMIGGKKQGLVFCECGTAHVIDLPRALLVGVFSCDCERQIVWIHPNAPILDILTDIVTAIELQSR